MSGEQRFDDIFSEVMNSPDLELPALSNDESEDGILSDKADHWHYGGIQGAYDDVHLRHKGGQDEVRCAEHGVQCALQTQPYRIHKHTSEKDFQHR